MSALRDAGLAETIGSCLPYLRRYARALTGRQQSGDTFAVAALEAILADPEIFEQDHSPKVSLFMVFHAIWTTTGSPVDPADADTGLEQSAQQRLAALTPNSREALLLHTIEEFSIAEIAVIMKIDDAEAAALIDIAYTEMARSAAGRVLIIEDEAIIAMDLEAMMSDLGHRVVGIARTAKGATEMAQKEEFDLILSDIQLADNSSGIDAVNAILDAQGYRPVIFITSFPERLLTGETSEPAFLISKPYTEEQVKSAASQAMFFSSIETLKA